MNLSKIVSYLFVAQLILLIIKLDLRYIFVSLFISCTIRLLLWFFRYSRPHDYSCEYLWLIDEHFRAFLCAKEASFFILFHYEVIITFIAIFS